ncbi:MAG: hypothetical protein ACOXZW_02040 [Bacilli bacterium]|jgi:hypothetical protein|nr:hypothetical protein [Bacilli bacterium]
MNENQKVFNCNDVMKILRCKKSKAYEIIKVLDYELKEKGYLTVNGKIPSSYLFYRLNIQ